MYASSAIKTYLNRKAHNGTPGIMDWPPQSPDLKSSVASSLQSMEQNAASIQRRV